MIPRGLGIGDRRNAFIKVILVYTSTSGRFNGDIAVSFYFFFFCIVKNGIPGYRGLGKVHTHRNRFPLHLNILRKAVIPGSFRRHLMDAQGHPYRVGCFHFLIIHIYCRGFRCYIKYYRSIFWLFYFHIW